MKFIKCAQCGDEKLIVGYLRDYLFKRVEKLNFRIHYFCCYDCMRKAERENPGKFCGRKS